MIAEVVPIIRLRRATSWWSYRIPAGKECLPGSVVRVRFRNRMVLGVVWEVRKERPADNQSFEIAEIVLEKPVVRNASRQFIEDVAEMSFASLSTIVFQWMPRVLRKSSISLPVLKAWRAAVAAFEERPSSPQYLGLWPAKRPYWEARFRQAGRETVVLSSELTEYEEWCAWLRIWKGDPLTVIGRERALYAPFYNLRDVVMLDPEDVSYFHEQIPYMWMTEGAALLARAYQATLLSETVLDAQVVQAFWPESKRTSDISPRAAVEITDLRHEPLINAHLVKKLKQSIELGRSAILLYNAHDRQGKSGVVIPGLETTRKRLAARLGIATLPSNIVVETRKVFDQPPIRPFFTAVLSADPLLESTVIANVLHGIADIVKLMRYPVPCVMQTHTPEHPLIQAAVNGTLSTYQQKLIAERRASHLPPFLQQIVAAFPGQENSALPTEVETVFQELKVKGEPNWQMSDPVLSKMGKKVLWNILLVAPRGTRLPSAVSLYLASLEKPWRILRDPWHLL
jgi:primosomal protein N'